MSCKKMFNNLSSQTVYCNIQGTQEYNKVNQVKGWHHKYSKHSRVYPQHNIHILHRRPLWAMAGFLGGRVH